MHKTIVPDDHVAVITFFLRILSQYITPNGVIHIGSHQGEEVENYLRFGFTKVVLIEADPYWAKVLESKYSGQPNISVFHYAVTNFDGSVSFHIHASQSGSTEPSSILPLKRFKDIVKTLHTERFISVPAIRLDTLFEKHGLRLADYNFLNIDIQGAEKLAFQGARCALQQLSAVLTEVNVIDLYEGGAREEEIEQLLGEYGFTRRESVYHELYDEVSSFPAWGESLFVKSGLAKCMREIPA